MTPSALAFSLGLGFLAGIVVFFVLQQKGVIDRWFESWDK